MYDEEEEVTKTLMGLRPGLLTKPVKGASIGLCSGLGRFVEKHLPMSRHEESTCIILRIAPATVKLDVFDVPTT